MPKVIVVEYDRSWPETFDHLRASLWPSLQDVATAIEHVGSTSVPGLAAKPIVDLTIIVPSPAAMTIVIERLAAIGYQHRGDLGVPGRESFQRPEGTPDHHLYACFAGNDGLRNHLAVRDYLRDNSEAARSYGNLKKRLAAQFADDIDGYIDGKTEFLLEILARTGFSPDQIAGIRESNRKPDGPK